MHINAISLEAKIQTIYYKTDKNILGQTYATNEKRITLISAEEILKQRNITFKEILKVQYENVSLELPLHVLQDFIK